MISTSSIKKLRVVIAQLNLCVGDIKGNLQQHIDAAKTARDELKADAILFPELSLTGYPPEDLLLRDDFIQTVNTALQTMIDTIKDIYCIVSYPKRTDEYITNTSIVFHNGKVIAQYAKMRLPNYGVFDENRYFAAGDAPCVTDIKGFKVGLVICEDLWFKQPVALACKEGAQVIFAPNASPFEVDKQEKRYDALTKRATQNHVPILYANYIGGQDELIFDGGSLAIDRDGVICQFAGYFNQTLLPIDLTLQGTEVEIQKSIIPTKPSNEEKIYHGLVLALKDYIEKNRFKGVLIGISGGIDSALTLAIAVDALGKDRVKGIIMPSRYTSDISMEDARAIIKNLNVTHEEISIEPIYTAIMSTLAPVFAGTEPDKTEENIQARARAIILMALSNKFGSLVLTTGNRSELAVGYCTLYGDMAGGFCVIKDLPKTSVYALATYRNQISPVIPPRTISRAPTAELAANQTDQDSLPPYSELDQILHHYLNDSESIEQICARGFQEAVVKKVLQLVQNSEYKRRQAAIGPRINNKSFGRDWRYPITNRFKL